MTTQVLPITHQIISPAFPNPPGEAISSISQLPLEQQIAFFEYLDRVFVGFPNREDRLRKLSELFSPEVQRMSVLLLPKETITTNPGKGELNQNQAPLNSNTVVELEVNAHLQKLQTLVTNGSTIRQLRINRGLSAKQVIAGMKKAAKELGYDGKVPQVDWLYAVESGRVKLSIKYVPILAQALGGDKDLLVLKAIATN